MNFDDDSGEDQVMYNKEFVHQFYQHKNFKEAVAWIVKWFKELKHNTTDFTAEYPALIDCGTDYRKE